MLIILKYLLKIILVPVAFVFWIVGMFILKLASIVKILMSIMTTILCIGLIILIYEYAQGAVALGQLIGNSIIIAAFIVFSSLIIIVPSVFIAVSEVLKNFIFES